MKKILLAFLLIPALAWGQTAITPYVVNGTNSNGSGAYTTCPVGTVASNACPMPVSPINGSGFSTATPLGYQQLSSLATATSLTVPVGAREAFIVCTGATINWRDDGTAPTSSVGVPLVINQPFPYTGNLAAIQLIQDTSSAVCNISYYR